MGALPSAFLPVSSAHWQNEQNPDLAYGHYLSATAQDKAGHGAEAVRHMERAVALAPDNQTPFFQDALEKLKPVER